MEANTMPEEVKTMVNPMSGIYAAPICDTLLENCKSVSVVESFQAALVALSSAEKFVEAIQMVQTLFKMCELDYPAELVILSNIVPFLAKDAGATETLKAAGPMKWVGLMNTCKAQAEEIVKHELIYV